MKRLGVNIDHVATIRNARGEHHPSPFDAAVFVSKLGADSVTIHLREDRRHINDLDAKKICSIKRLLINLEISTNSTIVKTALKIKPNYVCIVPENRKEITTEGGLNLIKNKTKINKLQNGLVPIFEPGLEALINKNVKSGRLLFGTDLKKFIDNIDVIFVAVDTPSRRGDGVADLVRGVERSCGLVRVLVDAGAEEQVLRHNGPGGQAFV